MSRLLSLYPKAWRARYGEEFAWLLRERPPKLRDRLDIVVGAIDARLHPQVGPAEAPERQLPGHPVIRLLAVVAGACFVVWAAAGIAFMPRWGAGDPTGPPGLLNLGWVSGMLGVLLAAITICIIAVRCGRAIGAAGLAGGLLTGLGLVLCAMGMGVPAMLILMSGGLLFPVAARGRILGTPAAAAFGLGVSAAAIGFIAFAASEGQELRFLWAVLALGPAWIVLGLGLREAGPQPGRDVPAAGLAGA